MRARIVELTKERHRLVEPLSSDPQVAIGVNGIWTEPVLGATWKRVTVWIHITRCLEQSVGLAVMLSYYCQGRQLDPLICNAVESSRACLAQSYSVGPDSLPTLSCSRIANTTRKDLSVKSVSLASLEMPPRPQPLPAGPAPARTSTLPEGQNPLRI